MAADRDAFGGPLHDGDFVRVCTGTFAGLTGPIVGYHRRPAYPVVRLTICGKPTDVWFHATELQRHVPGPQ